MSMDVVGLPMPRSSCLTSPSPLSELEAQAYYYGLPSQPVLVARTSTDTWSIAPGPWRYPVTKVLRPVSDHPITEVWESKVQELITLLDFHDIKWTSVDLVRIVPEEDGLRSHPAIIWIGVVPKSLSGDDGLSAAYKCKDILMASGMSNIEVEFRESVVQRLSGTGPKLLAPSSRFQTLTLNRKDIDIHEPLSTTLGIPISTLEKPHLKGTGTLFITDNNNPNSNHLYLITPRHVVLPGSTASNDCSVPHGGQDLQRHTVTLFNDASFAQYLKSIQNLIESKESESAYLQERLKRITTGATAATNADEKDSFEKRERHIKWELDPLTREVSKLRTFFSEVKEQWGSPQSRILGHVVLSPPLSVGVEGFTQDWALVKIDPSKIDSSNLGHGNTIDLFNKFQDSDLFSTMKLDRSYLGSSSDYEVGFLLPLVGPISEEEMLRDNCAPPLSSSDTAPNIDCDLDLDPNHSNSTRAGIPVLKSGPASGITLGFANNVFSLVRIYTDDSFTHSHGVSREWAILPRPKTSETRRATPFAAPGDSGSVVVDGRGRMGGMLTACTGRPTPKETDYYNSDISYATPMWYLLDCIRAHGIEPNVTPFQDVKA